MAVRLTFVGRWTYVPFVGVVQSGGGSTREVGDTMPFEIEFIEDSQLPEGIDWVQAADDRGRMFFVKRSRVCPEVLAEAWAAGTRFTVRAAS